MMNFVQDGSEFRVGPALSFLEHMPIEILLSSELEEPNMKSAFAIATECPV